MRWSSHWLLSRVLYTVKIETVRLLSRIISWLYLEILIDAPWLHSEGEVWGVFLCSNPNWFNSSVIGMLYALLCYIGFCCNKMLDFHFDGTGLYLLFNPSDAGDGIIRLWGSVPYLLMPWLLKSPEHQQAWYWLYGTANMSTCSRVNFVYLRQAKSEIRFNMWLFLLSSLK